MLRLDNGDIAMVTRTVETGEVPDLVLVKTADGTLLDDPEPIPAGGRTVVDQVIPGQVGVDPAALLEKAGIDVAPV